MSTRSSRRGLLLGAAALAFAGPAAAQITVSRRFRAGRAVSLASPAQIEALPNLLQGSLGTARSAATVVHVPLFRVEVAKQMKKSARTRGFGAAQTTTFLFENVDDAAMQAMTQRLYDQFVAGLTAAGYRVASMAETQADPNLARFFNNRPGPMDGPVPEGQSTFYSPLGLSVNPISGDTRTPGGLGAMSVISDMAATAMGATRAAMAGAIVLAPRYCIGFASVDASSDHFLGDLGNTASVTGRGGVFILAEATRVEAFVPAARAGQFTQDWVAVTSPLTLGGVDAGPIHDATTDAQRRDAVAGQVINVLGALAGLGSGTTSQYNTSAVTAGPRLTETTEPYLSAIQDQFLKALRPTA